MREAQVDEERRWTEETIATVRAAARGGRLHAAFRTARRARIEASRRPAARAALAAELAWLALQLGKAERGLVRSARGVSGTGRVAHPTRSRQVPVSRTMPDCVG